MNRHTVFGFCAILLWSFTIALVRRISEQLGPLTAGASVYLTSGFFLLTFHLIKERSFKKMRKLPRLYVIGCGALFVIYTISLFLALGLAENRLQSVAVGLLNYLWPALTLLFSLFILGNQASFGMIPGTLLALGGVFLVLTQGTQVSLRSFLMNFYSNPVAYGLGLLAAVSWALYSNLSRRWGKSAGSGAVPLFTLATGMVFLLIRIQRPEQGIWSMRAVAELTFLALATALAYFFWDMAMRKGDVVLVASGSYLTPFFSTVVSCFYLGVLPGANLWLGCLLIIAGSFLSWRSVSQAS